MAGLEMAKYLAMLPALLEAPRGYVWSSYDEEADVLYINFKKPAHATDSDLTDDDVIIRYEGAEIVGLTVLHASARGKRGVAARAVGEAAPAFKTRPARQTTKK